MLLAAETPEIGDDVQETLDHEIELANAGEWEALGLDPPPGPDSEFTAATIDEFLNDR